MSILSGFFKTIKYRMTDQGYKWQSEKTSSQTVVMGDGTDNTDTAEKRFGAIKGLTSSTSVTDTGYALDATIGKKHEDSIAALNQSLSFKVNTNDSRLSDARTPTAHTHDDRYYTESEINSKLNKYGLSSTPVSGVVKFSSSTTFTPMGNNYYFAFGLLVVVLLSFTLNSPKIVKGNVICRLDNITELFATSNVGILNVNTQAIYPIYTDGNSLLAGGDIPQGLYYATIPLFIA